MYNKINDYLKEVEQEIVKQTEKPIHLSLVNWLEGFILGVYESGGEDSDLAKIKHAAGFEEGMEEGFEKGYKECIEDNDLE